MKKKVLGLALMAMTLVGFNGMAQNQAQSCNSQSCKAQTECTKGSKGMKKAAREAKNPYEGLNLTDAQKSKLAELDSKRMADRKAKMEARKADANGQKADKKNMTDAEKQAAKKAMMEARKADKIEYLQEVKEIIGPDQYVVFLENFYVNGGGQQGGKAIKQGQRDGKKGIAHNKGGKDQRKGDRKGSGKRAGNTTANNAQS